MDVTGRNRRGGEERVARHLVVAPFVVARHEALVAEEDLPARPVDLIAMALDEQLIGALRRIPARQRNRESPARPQTIPGNVDDDLGGCIAQRLEIREHSHFTRALSHPFPVPCSRARAFGAPYSRLDHFCPLRCISSSDSFGPHDPAA
jgi:hypothetical protein